MGVKWGFNGIEDKDGFLCGVSGRPSREVVAEVKEAKGYEKQDVALTEVLDEIHKKFPPAKLAEMSEIEAGTSIHPIRDCLITEYPVHN